MTRPLIGISGNHLVDEGGPFAGYHRAYVNHDYVRSITEAGGVPMVIPFNEDAEAVKECVARIDALLMTGGHDICPLNYGEEPHQKIGPVWPERDAFDLLLIKEAEKRRIPIMGICRGLQILNVAHGGTLYQDLSLDKNCYIKHAQKQDPATATHSILIEEGSRLAKIIGQCQWVTNSHHHQTVHKVGEGFKVTARAKDGTVESLEGTNYSYLMAYQFHPEMMSAKYALAKKIFVDFIVAAGK